MSYIIKDYKVNLLPPTGEPNARYYVLNVDNTVDEYITDKLGNFRKVGKSLTVSAGTSSNTLNNITFSNNSLVTFGLSNNVITASVNTAGSLSQFILSNSNGLSFGTNAGTVTGSYTVPTNYISSNQSSLFQQTSQMSDYLTSQSIQTQSTFNSTVLISYQQTSAMSNYQLTSDNSLSLGTNYTTHTHSQYINNSQSSLFEQSSHTTLFLTSQSVQTQGTFNTTQLNDYQLTANNSLSLGTAYTTHTHSQYLTGQTQLILSNSNGISFGTNGSTVTASYTTPTDYVSTNQSSLFQQTSQMSNYQTTGNYLTSQSNQAISAANGSFAFQTASFANSNGVSFSTGTQGIFATVKTDYQSSGNYLTTARASTDAVGLNTAQTNVTWTVNSSGISFNASAYFNTSASSNFVLTANSSLFQATSATSNITSNALNTSASRVINLLVATNNTGGGTASLSSNISFSNANNISFYTSAGNAIVASFSTSQSVQTQNLHNVTLSGNTAGVLAQISSGTLTIAGGNNITLSQNGNAITISGANVGGAQTGISGIVLSNTTYSSGTASFIDGNGISFASTTGQGISITHGLQHTSNTSNITSNAFNTSGSSNFILTANSSLFRHTSADSQLRFTSADSQLQFTSAMTNYLGTAESSKYMQNWKLTGNTAGTSSSAQGTDLWLAGGNGVTISGSSNTLSFSVATNYQSQGAYLTTAMQTGSQSQLWIMGNSSATIGGTNISGTVFSNGMSLSVAAPGAGGGVAASISGNSTSAGAGYSNITSGTMILAGGPNITLSQNGSIISISANNPGAAAENNWGNLLGANTAGNTTFSGSTIGYSGINLTLSGTNASVMNISAPATSSLSATGALSISVNGSTISMGVPIAYDSYYAHPIPFMINSAATAPRQSTSVAFPLIVDWNLTFRQMLFPVSYSFASTTFGGTSINTTISGGLSETNNFVLYKRGTGASSQSLQSVSSFQYTQAMSINVGMNSTGSQYTVTHGGTYNNTLGSASTWSASYAVSSGTINISTTGLTAFTGLKKRIISWSGSMAPDNYWMVWGVSSTTATQGIAALTQGRLQWSHIGLSNINNAIGFEGVINNASLQIRSGIGSFSTAGGGTTANLNFSNISSHASNLVPYLTFISIQ